MSSVARKPLPRVLSILALALGVSGASAAVAGATTRYASPAGGGDCSTPVAACDLATAVGNAADGDEVIVGTGTYNLSAPVVNASTVKLSIHGDASKAAPQIDSSAPVALQVDDPDSTVAYLRLTDTAPDGRAIVVNGSVAEQVWALAPGSGQTAACELTNGTLRDSVCVGSYDGVLADGQNAISIRNVTAIGGTGWAVHAHSSGTSPKVTVLNTIARDMSNPYGIWADASGGSVSVTVSSSNYDQAYVQPGGSASVTDTGHHQTAAPTFVDAAHGDYHEAAGSPTIGAGLTDPADAGTLDVDRQFRTRNGATDIGADEWTAGFGVVGVGTTPVLSAVSLSRARFAVKLRGHHKAHVHYGSSIRLTLSELAQVHFSLAKKTTGRLAGEKCAKPSSRNRHGKRCTRWVGAGSFTHSAKKGPSTFAFSGKLGKRVLKPGSYRMTLVAVDDNGHRSAKKTLSFRIVKG